MNISPNPNYHVDRDLFSGDVAPNFSVSAPITRRAPASSAAPRNGFKIECEGCGEHLLDVVVEDRKVEKVRYYKATCPACGDRSALTPVKGAHKLATRPDAKYLIVKIEDLGKDRELYTLKAR